VRSFGEEGGWDWQSCIRSRDSGRVGDCGLEGREGGPAARGSWGGVEEPTAWRGRRARHVGWAISEPKPLSLTELKSSAVSYG